MEQSDVSILIVDDVQTMRIQLKELLRSFGFKNLQIAGSVAEAQLILNSTPVQLILCDWHMAPVNGLELLTLVRAHANSKNAAFIMVTAEATKDCVVQALKAGVDDYILKPLVLSHVNKIYKVLLKSRCFK